MTCLARSNAIYPGGTTVLEGPGVKRVTGIGGIFFKARNPKKMAEWYRDHLGIDTKGGVMVFEWRGSKKPSTKGHTVWAIFPRDSDYFGKGPQFMINYRVKNLRAVLRKLKAEGADVDPKVEEHPYGRFGWVTDPEGNRVELWEPPARHKTNEPMIQSE